MKVLIVFLMTFFSLASLAKPLFIKALDSRVHLQNLEEDISWEPAYSGYYVVQLKDRVSHERQFSTLGLKVVRYVPEDAALVWLEKEDVSRLKNSLSVEKVWPYKPYLKMDAQLRAAYTLRDQKARYVILFFNETHKRDFMEKFEDIEVVYTISGESFLVAWLPNSLLSEVAEFQGVEWIEEEKTPTLAVSNIASEENSESEDREYELTGLETGTELLKLPMAWAKGFAGQGEFIAVADTGLSTGDKTTFHKDFKKRILDGHGWAHTNDPRGFLKWNDDQGHGTHVMGSVLGDGFTSGFHLRGAAYKAYGYVQKFFRKDGFFLTSYMHPFSDFLGSAYLKGAYIHSDSWGISRAFGYGVVSSHIDRFIWNHPLMLVVFAAGNNGADLKDIDGRVDEGSISEPAIAKNVLSVGASENYVLKGGFQSKMKDVRGLSSKFSKEPLSSDRVSNSFKGLALFSSRGPTKDGRLKPEVVATGTNVLSACIKKSKMHGSYNESYCFSNGTSMATPLVAGSAAILRQFVKETYNINPTSALLKALMTHTAEDLFPGQFGFREKGQELLKKAPNFHQGFGRLDMHKATQKENYLLVRSVKWTRDRKWSVKVPKDARGVKITLFYVDAPGAAFASKALVNDLDIKVVTADGQTVMAQDRLNNFEYLTLEGENLRGDLEVHVVTHRAINMGPGKGIHIGLVVSKLSN